MEIDSEELVNRLRDIQDVHWTTVHTVEDLVEDMVEEKRKMLEEVQSTSPST